MAGITGPGDWGVDSSSWPWPQVFFLEYYTLFFAENTDESEGELHVFEAYCDTSNVWQAGSDSIRRVGTISETDYVTVADFGPFYVISTMELDGNAISVDSYQKDPLIHSTLTVLPTDYAPEFGCCCNFNGQAVIGAILNSDDFPDVSWNSVMWSEVGKFDFRIGEVEHDGYEGIDKVKKINRTSGYRHMPWGERGTGIVYRVEKLGNGVMAYGDGGIALLEPVSQPFSTYKLAHISGAGIKQGTAMAGDDKIHFWVDTYDQLWLAGADYKPQKLGYKEFMEDLSGNIKLSYCADRKRLYISDGSTGYVLTEHGLYSTDQYCTSVGTYRGTLTGFFIDGDDREIRITTDTLDFGQRGLKTLEELEFGANYYNASGDELQARVQWRADYQSDRDSFNDDEGWKRLSPRGTVFPVVTGSEFRIKLKGTTYESSVANIDWIKARLKLVDKHSVRGLYTT